MIHNIVSLNATSPADWTLTYWVRGRQKYTKRSCLSELSQVVRTLVQSKDAEIRVVTDSIETLAYRPQPLLDELMLIMSADIYNERYLSDDPNEPFHAHPLAAQHWNDRLIGTTPWTLTRLIAHTSD